MKVKNFDDYRKRLAEHFVVLDRSERHDRIARELDAEARRRGGRIARSLVGQGMLDEVPDLVEYPVVVSGAFAEEFLQLPEEVLTTTMIHHQHFFPVDSDQGKLLPVFLAVLNMEPEQPDVIVAQHGARADGAAARRAVLLRAIASSRWRSYQSGSTRCCSTRRLAPTCEKAERVSKRWRADLRRGVRRRSSRTFAREAGRLCKADLATDMVRELTELQGTMGGIYAREDGRPEEVWKAIYFHYLPVGVEANRAAGEGTARQGGDRPGRRCRSPTSSIPWSACSLPASGRPDRAIRTACAARRRALCASSSTCPS